MPDDVEARLKECFRTVFPDLVEMQIPSASQLTVAAWDSVATVTLINLIEEEFGIELDLDRLAEFDSFQSFLLEIQSQLKVS